MVGIHNGRPVFSKLIRKVIARDGRLFGDRFMQVRLIQLGVGLNGLDEFLFFLVQLFGGVAGQTQIDRKLFVREGIDDLSDDGARRRGFLRHGLGRCFFVQQAAQRIIRILR